MLRPIAVALIALLLVAPHHHGAALAANFAATPLNDLPASEYLGAEPGLHENTTHGPSGHYSSTLATAGASSRPLIVAAIVGGCVIAPLMLVAFFARRGAFSRSVDHRRVRRAKFQDDWTGVIRAADERAREIANRKEK